MEIHEIESHKILIKKYITDKNVDELRVLNLLTLDFDAMKEYYNLAADLGDGRIRNVL